MSAAIKNIVFSGGRLAANVLVPVLVLPMLRRQVGPEVFGDLMIAQAIFMYMQVCSEYAFHIYGTSLIAKNESNANLVRINSEILMARIMAFLIVAVIFGATFVFCNFGLNSCGVQLKLAGWSLVYAFACSVSPIWFLQGVQRFDVIFWAQVTPKLLVYIYILIAGWTEKDLLIIHNLMLFPWLVSAVFMVFYVDRKFGYVIPSGRAAMNHLALNSSSFLGVLSSSIFTYANTLLVSVFAGSVQAGSFALADRLVRSIVQIMVPFTEGLFPVMAKLFGENRVKAYQIIRRMTIIGFVATVCMVALLDFLFYFMGNELNQVIAVDARVCVMILLPIFIFIYINNMAGMQIMVNAGFFKEYGRVVMSGAFLTLVFSVALVGYFGAVGAAWAIFFGELVLCVGMMVVSFRCIGFNWLGGRSW